MVKLVNQYILGTLTGAELHKFRDQLSTDLDLQRQVREHRLLLDHLEYSYKGQLKKQFQDASRPKRFQLGIAASIIILAGSVFFLMHEWDRNKRLTNRFLFLPEEINLPLGDQRSQEGITESLQPILSVQHLYNTGQYEDALQELKKINPSEHPISLEYYKGLTCLQINQWEQARNHFNMSVEDQDMSLWYLALIQLREGNLDDSRKILHEISSRHHPRKEQARLLLGKIGGE